MTTVYNVATGEVREYPGPAEEAVRAAFIEDKGGVSAWQPNGGHRGQVQYGDKMLACGNWLAYFTPQPKAAPAPEPHITPTLPPGLAEFAQVDGLLPHHIETLCRAYGRMEGKRPASIDAWQDFCRQLDWPVLEEMVARRQRLILHRVW
jgi:hypothetical protein